MARNIYRRTAHDCVSLKELALYHAIMDYRASKGLEAVPLSKGLNATAGRHVIDTRENIWGEGMVLPADANLHSWSDAPYYADARAPEAMWFAPDRLGTSYDAHGYEISAAGYADTDAALQGWKESPVHNAVLANLGGWKEIDFRAIGIGAEPAPGAGPCGGRAYHVWFGTESDPGGAPVIEGSARSERIAGTGFGDIVKAGGGKDVVIGGAGRDRLESGGGPDLLKGQSGQDRLDGGPGADTLRGGGGADKLIGGPGGDALYGGGGADVFVFRRPGEAGKRAWRDEVADFDPAEDNIDLSRIDARPDRRGDQDFTFIGTDTFSGKPGELRAGGGRVAGDTDGDRIADFQIALDGAGRLVADDFAL